MTGGGMRRDLAALAGEHYDLLIIGGGIYGAALLWEATLRGLSAALVEQRDFCAATSANSLKIIHGGLRYLQHADLPRMRESIRERRALMRIAPHLVHPLPTLVPTYGHGMRSREVMALAMLMNDLISADRNRGLTDPEKHIPRGRTVSREVVQHLAPGIDAEGLTGGAIYYDAQVYNSERLPLAFIRSAVERGARAANYAEATGLLRRGDAIEGAQVTDRLSGQTFDVRARMVVNTAGPWINRVLGLAVDGRSGGRTELATAINLVTPPLFEKYAVGVYSAGQYEDADAILNKGSRLFFVAPWRGMSIVGTDYAPFKGDPDEFRVTREEVEAFLAEYNRAHPAAELSVEDVTFVHGGLLPMTGYNERTRSVQLQKHFTLDDHRRDGLRGLLTVVGVKYTTARDVAQRAADRVFELWGQRPPRSTSAETTLHGGDIRRFDDTLGEQVRADPYHLGPEAMRRLVYNYGSAVPEVLQYVEGEGEDAAIAAETRHAVREEMAQTLADVLLRRTELGTARHPGAATLRLCADVMAAELGWSEARVQQEIEDVNTAYPEWAVEREVAGGAQLAG